MNLGLRWEPVFDYHESQGKEATFVPGQHSTVFKNAPQGLLFVGDKGYGSTIIPPDWNNFGPRVGLAYQLTPRQLRSAYGVFYRSQSAIMMNRSAQGQPLCYTVVDNGGGFTVFAVRNSGPA